MQNKAEKKKEKEKTEKKFPKSPFSGNSLKDFAKICRAYYNEVMHVSKQDKPNLSQNDLIVVDNLLQEVLVYSEQLIHLSYINEAKSLIELGLVISDFLLKIFGSIPENKDKVKNLKEKLNYPLSKKLILLEANFNVLFKLEKNFSDAEKNLEEIIELQQYLNLPIYNLASSKFYMALINFYINKINYAEKYAKEALDMLEKKNVSNPNDSNKREEEENNPNIYENRKSNKMSNILEFLAELYILKKNYLKAQDCYEKAYYINLGRYGAQNVNTEYYKKKFDFIKQEYPQLSQSNNLNNNNNNMSNSNSNFNRSSPNKLLTSNSGFSPNKSVSNKSSNTQQILLHKGKSDTFSFKIPTSNFYEPLLISIYSLPNNNNKESNPYSPEFFVCNLCFDKIKLLKYLKEYGNDNSVFYTDDNLNTILGNICLVEGYISFLDFGLRNCLINNPNQG